MVASRDIRAGEVIFEEMPLTFGPSDNSRPVCLGCYQVRSDVFVLVNIFFGENVPFGRTILYRISLIEDHGRGRRRGVRRRLRLPHVLGELRRCEGTQGIRMRGVQGEGLQGEMKDEVGLSRVTP